MLYSFEIKPSHFVIVLHISAELPKRGTRTTFSLRIKFIKRTQKAPVMLTLYMFYSVSFNSSGSQTFWRYVRYIMYLFFIYKILFYLQICQDPSRTS